MSSRRFITQGEGLPQWSSPISHAVVVGNTCHISGQLSVDISGKYIAGTAYEEADRAFTNFLAVVKAAGFSKDDVVFVDIAFINLADVDGVNVLFAELFAEGKRPARTIYQASALPFGGKIKVTGVAIKDNTSDSPKQSVE
ncbi:RidA family protein [Pseudanabaena sp. FACHB-2040]|uniref:Rid family hydrolase n=1 Tax=Pseudanabaena sp. FACHB-2040 TaxID=2692859 RepID=UPI001682FBA5|nr:RidA family protein [Pseudanabaena sp. FACHB-2040]